MGWAGFDRKSDWNGLRWVGFFGFMWVQLVGGFILSPILQHSRTHPVTRRPPSAAPPLSSPSSSLGTATLLPLASLAPIQHLREVQPGAHGWLCSGCWIRHILALTNRRSSLAIKVLFFHSIYSLRSKL